MEEEIDLLRIVSQRLENANIEYMLTGSMSLALYATPRMTRDIDIIIQISPADINNFIKLFENDFYIDEFVVRNAIKQKSMFNIIHNETIIKIDFIIRKENEYRITEFNRRQKIYIYDSSIYSVSLEDLILSKLVWMKDSLSETQKNDIKDLLESQTNINFEYIDKWADFLNVSNLLNEIKLND